MSDIRCPHDGGKCHHGCIGTCQRKMNGASLSTPWPGFPRDTDAPVLMTIISDEPVNDITLKGVSIIPDGLLVDLKRCTIDFNEIGWAVIRKRPSDLYASRRPVNVNPFTGEIIK